MRLVAYEHYTTGKLQLTQYGGNLKSTQARPDDRNGLL
jgi:hypothetical protein